MRFSLYEASSQQPIKSYEVHRILFYARGEMQGPCAACFAFTWSHGDTQESARYQCHVFRCDIPEAVSLLFIEMKNSQNLAILILYDALSLILGKTSIFVLCKSFSKVS